MNRYGGRKYFCDLIVNDSLAFCNFLSIPVFLFLASEETMCDHDWVKTKFELNLTGEKPYWVFRVCKKCGTGSFIREKKEKK